MKTILKTLYVICAIIEYLWSIPVSVMEAIGQKLNELTDSIEVNIQKIEKSKG